MKANPGGQISSSEIIGRDQLVRRLWEVLERQSLVLTAERRMGKTCVIKKMIANAPPGKLVIPGRETPTDLEQVHTSLEFVETVFSDVEAHLSTYKRVAERTRKFLREFTGAEFEGFKLPTPIAPHWKKLLTEIIEDLFHQEDQDVVFFWDEMPLMLYNIKQSESESRAMELLDVLRSLRQTHTRLRMVFTGSIGLHQVLTSLKRSGYANSSTNDMFLEDVSPLSSSEARKLARLLLEGENIKTSDLEKTVEAIATTVDAIPYYIHHVVDQLKNRGGQANVRLVEDIVSDSLIDPQDRWHMGHYRERINTYYLPDEQPFALGLLDILSVAKESLQFDELFNLLKSRIITEDEEMVRSMLTMLQRDHYISQDRSGAYRFRFPLIQRSWRLQRGLGA